MKIILSGLPWDEARSLAMELLNDDKLDRYLGTRIFEANLSIGEILTEGDILRESLLTAMAKVLQADIGGK